MPGALALALILAASWYGLTVPLSPHAYALPWVAYGIGTGFAIRFGPKVLGWVFAAYVVGMAAASGLPWTAAIGIALLQVLVLRLALHQLEQLDFRVPLTRRRDLNLYFAVVVVLASLLGGTLESAGLHLAPALAGQGRAMAWLACSLNQVMGAVFVAPLLVAWDAEVLEPFLRRSRQLWIDLTLLGVSTAVAAWTMLSDSRSEFDPIGLSVPVLLLALMAVRRGVALTAVGALIVALLAIHGTWRGTAPFATDRSGHALEALWAHLLVLGATAMAFPAVTAELRSSGERWRLALAGSSIGLGDWHMESGRLYLSDRFKAMLGHAEDELKDHYSEWRSRLHPDDVPRIEHAMRAHLRGDEPHVHTELRLRCKDGSWKWFEVHGSIVTRSLRNRGLRFVGYAIDITARREVAERLRLSANLFENLHEGLIITDVDYRIIEVNEAFERLSGRSSAELQGQLPELLRADVQNTELLNDMWASLRATGSWKGEATGVRRDGAHYPQQVTISVVRDENDLITHHVLVVSDITQARLAREQLEYQAHYDPLTQLPNRHRLQQMMRKAIAAVDRDREHKHQLAVCYLDMDHFKPVNDRFGHGVGDQLLAELASRMRLVMRDGDAVARLGGDEFAMLLRVSTLQECEMALDRILRAVTEPYQLEGHGAWTLTASIGVTLYPQDNSNPDTLLRHADHAMYGAKQAGRNRAHFFDAEDDRQTTRRREALKRLEEAISAGELLLHYQPKVNMHNGQVVGVEALLRWQHPQRGLLPPGEFLPLSEAPELLVHLGDWVLAQAVRQLNAWQRAGLHLSVSVNVSGAHLQHPRFVQRLSEILNAAGQADAQGLELEVLETAAFEDVELTSRLMERCRSLGARFALDDFGTGYSTLTYLKRLPVEVLKIDHSFVRSMLTDAQDLAIVEGVIGLSRTFGCTVVAEGVESEEHAQQLVALGCEIGQGYGIASPMPALDIPGWLASRSLAPALPASGRSALDREPPLLNTA